MAVSFKDYYETLGIPKTATAAEIKSAFRKLARKHHPDMVQSAADKAAAEETFKAINEAYEVLSDPDKRKRYDELGAHWQQGGPPPPSGDPGAAWQSWGGDSGDASFEFSGTGFSDFFEQFFGTGSRGFGASPHGARNRSAAFRGHDIEADLLVTLEEAVHGAVRELALRRPGADPSREESFQVRIPAGVREGQKLRVPGHGAPGNGGADAGDLYLHVRFARHPDFRVQGTDLFYDLDLAPWEAALGTHVTIPTIGGSVTIKVPPGTATGSQLRVRGQGLPQKSGSRGDLYAVIRLQIPSDLTAEERSHWEALARISTFNPRNLHD